MSAVTKLDLTFFTKFLSMLPTIMVQLSLMHLESMKNKKNACNACWLRKNVQLNTVLNFLTFTNVIIVTKIHTKVMFIRKPFKLLEITNLIWLISALAKRYNQNINRVNKI